MEAPIRQLRKVTLEFERYVDFIESAIDREARDAAEEIDFLKKKISTMAELAAEIGWELYDHLEDQDRETWEQALIKANEIGDESKKRPRKSDTELETKDGGKDD